MRLARFPRPSLALLALLLSALPAHAQKPGPSKAPLAKPAPKAEAKADEPSPDQRRVLGALRSKPSPATENEADEADPAFDPIHWLKRGKPTGAASSAATATAHLCTHPKRDELAKWLVDSLRGREIDVALLGGEKYMINDCLGLKASAGKFRLKLENPSVRFENSGMVVKFEIDHVALSAVKVRIRPNPNVLEACKFSKKFEVGGSMKDVTLTLHPDPLYEVERCRIGSLGNLNPEVRIGNLNLKPLQNDLDRMAKNMIEDSLTVALQLEVDGFLSAFGELLCSSIDQFLEADCPTHPGDTTKALGDVARGVGLGGRQAGRGGNASAPTTPPTAGGPSAASSYSEQEVAALLARIEELEARISELEQRKPSSGDLSAVLEEALRQVSELGAGGSAGPDFMGVLAKLVAAALDRGSSGDRRAVLDQVASIARKTLEQAQPSGAAAAPWSPVANPELKGRMGRILVSFADAKLAGSTLVSLRRGEKSVADHYGSTAWELLPETYDVLVTNVPVASVQVRSGHDTILKTGVLAVELSGNTLFSIYTKGGTQSLYDHYGTAGVGLPIGTYEVEIQGQRETVTVRENETTRL